MFCRRDTPARRLIGGADRTGGGLAGAADAYRQAYHLYHLVCRAGKSAVPCHLHAADGEAELCAVYRQYHVHQGDGGDIEGIHTPLRELFSQCLRAVQATGLPGGKEPARGALQGRRLGSHRAIQRQPAPLYVRATGTNVGALGLRPIRRADPYHPPRGRGNTAGHHRDHALALSEQSDQRHPTDHRLGGRLRRTRAALYGGGVPDDD